MKAILIKSKRPTTTTTTTTVNPETVCTDHGPSGSALGIRHDEHVVLPQLHVVDVGSQLSETFRKSNALCKKIVVISNCHFCFWCMRFAPDVGTVRLRASYG